MNSMFVMSTCWIIYSKVTHTCTFTLVFIILAFLIFTGLPSFMADERTSYALKWCPWSKWGPCSPVHCFHGYTSRDYLHKNNREPTGEVDGQEINYCVVFVSNSSTKPRKALVQETKAGHQQILVPQKQRFRLCNCPKFSVFSIFNIPVRNECQRYGIQYECLDCKSNETIYINRDSHSESDIIPYCVVGNTAVHIYKILGGVAGAALFICAIVCLSRFLFKQSWFRRSRQNDELNNNNTDLNSRRNRSIFGRSDNNTDNLNSHRNHIAYTPGVGPPLDSDLPPAYSDVVKLPNLGFITNQDFCNDSSNYELIRNEKPVRITNVNKKFYIPNHLSSSSLNENENCNNFNKPSSSNQINETKSSDSNTSPTPPPPTYEEIIVASNALSIINPNNSKNNNFKQRSNHKHVNSNPLQEHLSTIENSNINADLDTNLSNTVTVGNDTFITNPNNDSSSNNLSNTSCDSNVDLKKQYTLLPQSIIDASKLN